MIAVRLDDDLNAAGGGACQKVPHKRLSPGVEVGFGIFHDQQRADRRAQGSDKDGQSIRQAKAHIGGTVVAAGNIREGKTQHHGIRARGPFRLDAYR